MMNICLTRNACPDGLFLRSHQLRDGSMVQEWVDGALHECAPVVIFYVPEPVIPWDSDHLAESLLGKVADGAVVRIR